MSFSVLTVHEMAPHVHASSRLIDLVNWRFEWPSTRFMVLGNLTKCQSMQILLMTSCVEWTIRPWHKMTNLNLKAYLRHGYAYDVDDCLALGTRSRSRIT